MMNGSLATVDRHVQSAREKRKQPESGLPALRRFPFNFLYRFALRLGRLLLLLLLAALRCTDRKHLLF